MPIDSAFNKNTLRIVHKKHKKQKQKLSISNTSANYNHTNALLTPAASIQTSEEGSKQQPKARAKKQRTTIIN
jgi:hypothetical protein